MSENQDVFERDAHNRVRRLPERGVYERSEIYAIIDEALICHLSFVQDGQPYIIPTNFGRDGDSIVLHGSRSSRMIQQAASGEPVCLAFTLVDGLVLARSTFHSSMNYRSAVVFGRGTLVEGEGEKRAALEVVTEHLARGRWADTRPVTSKELGATAVVRIQIESASAKRRSGPPADDEEDYALPMWAGVLPVELTAGEPIDDPRLKAGTPLPAYLEGYRRKKGVDR